MWRDRVARPVRRCSRGTEDSALDSDSVDVFQIVFDRLEVVEPLPSQGDIDAPGARDLVSSAAGLSVLPKIFSAIQPPQFCAVIGHAGLYTGIHLAQPAALRLRRFLPRSLVVLGGRRRIALLGFNHHIVMMSALGAPVVALRVRARSQRAPRFHQKPEGESACVRATSS